jgi:hypothetical protein
MMRQQAAVDGDHLAGDEGRVVRDEEHDRGRDVLRRAEARRQMVALEQRDLLRRHVLSQRRRLDHARRDRVAADAALAVLRRHVAREAVDAGLRDAVGGAHQVAGEP